MREKVICISSIVLLMCIIFGDYSVYSQPVVSYIGYTELKTCNSEINLFPEDYITRKNSENSVPISVDLKELTNITYSVLSNSKKISNYMANNTFPLTYSKVEGVLTFRGNNLRTSPSYGISNISEKKLNVSWDFTTTSSTWGAGAGWTGQPAIVKWSKEIREVMNLKDKFKEDENFTEVIYASLDGNIYFLDLKTGDPTRDSIRVGNPIKGSLSIDPRGIPLLYVGDGIPEKGSIGYNIFSLIDGSKLFFIDGIDYDALRGWGAFDSSTLVNKDTDTLIAAGENGLIYIVELNTSYNFNENYLSIKPEVTKYRYEVLDNPYQGIENSVAVYKNLLYFADNGGSIQCIDLLSLKPVWIYNAHDDTDASLVIDLEDDIPYIYSGNEVDIQGSKGYSYLKKINGLTGELLWEKPYECMSIIGDNPINGGLLATPVIGKHNTNNMVIFALARYKDINSGLLVALDKSTGTELWRKDFPNYMWSSPVDFYDEFGNTFIIQCDSIGNMYLLDGETGSILNTINLGSNIEATPSIFNDTIVVATRSGQIYGINIK